MNTILTATIAARVVFAGLPQFDPELEPQMLTLPVNVVSRTLESMIVCGSSMDSGHENSIRDGDVIRVDRADLEPRVGKVYVVAVVGLGEIVKRVCLIDGLLWLCSDNPDFEDFRADEAVIVGRVKDIVRLIEP